MDTAAFCGSTDGAIYTWGTEAASPRGLLLSLDSKDEARLPTATYELPTMAWILTLPLGRALSLPGPYIKAQRMMGFGHKGVMADRQRRLKQLQPRVTTGAGVRA